MDLHYLFQPLELNGLTLKNRLVMLALHHMYTPDGAATPRFNEYYWRRAEGGAALVITGGCMIDDYHGYAGIMSLQNDTFIPGYREFTDGMHQRGAKVAVQLMQTGRYGKSKYIYHDTAAIAPSAVYSSYTRETPRAMTLEEIQTVIQSYAKAAARAREAGFDMVEVTGASGYLISQFLSPITNLREDAYGGSFENRCRFPLEMVQAIRQAVGRDYPLSLRVAGNDFMPGGNTNEDCVQFCRLLEQAGVDLINVTGGWHETTVPQLPGDVPRGGYAYLAQAVKDAVSIPVLSSNRYNDPLVAERALALGQADLIGIGRTLVADPDWPRKAAEGRLDEIRKCVACNQGCLGRMFFDKPIECLVNGYAGREYLLQDIPKRRAKNLLVVGGGPAGCEFAVQAALRGNRVTLWEQGETLGGQVNLAAVPPAKQEFHNLTDYHRTMLKKTGVEVILRRTAAAEDIRSGGFDSVILATGAVQNTIPLPGTGTIPVYSFADILEQKAIAGRNTVVIGGGSVGCETAAYLAHEAALSPQQLYFLLSQQAETTEKVLGMMNSSRRDIALVDLAKIGAGFDPGCGWPVLKDLKRLGVRQYPFASITDITDSEVHLQHKDQKTGQLTQVTLPCDTIVLAVGSKPDTALYDALKDSGMDVHPIGDAAGIGKVLDAIRQADDLALQLY